MDASKGTQTGLPNQRFISLQTMWRSCGTYVFDKFRQDRYCHPYFEPCSEYLLSSSPESIYDAFPPEARDSLRHSGVQPQSFAKFPFAELGGVEGYRQRFAFERYYVAPDEDDPELEEYVTRLTAYAHAQGKTPVAKWCRFGLRALWLKRVSAPLSIYVIRDPDAMFRSYWSFGGRRSYFIVASVLIFAKNHDVGLFRELAEEIGIPPVGAAPIHDELAAARRIACSLEAQDIRDLVLLLWASTLAHNCRASDLCVDIDLLVGDRFYRHGFEDSLAALSGFSLTFDDIQRTSLPEAPGRVLSERGIACASNAIRWVLGGAALQEPRLSEQSRDVLTALL